MSNKALKDLTPDELPREKAKKYGITELNNVDLLAIILRTGVKGMNILELASSILSLANNDLYILSNIGQNELLELKGMGEVKATQIAAFFELSKRIRDTPRTEINKVNNSRDIFDRVYELSFLDYEEVWVVLLNNSNKIITIDKTFKGGITSSMVDVRRILKKAIMNNAVKIVIVHNHPTGQLFPSKQDDILTQKVGEACSAINISLLDHLIVGVPENGRPDYFSYSENDNAYLLK